MHAPVGVEPDPPGLWKSRLWSWNAGCKEVSTLNIPAEKRGWGRYKNGYAGLTRPASNDSCFLPIEY